MKITKKHVGTGIVIVIGLYLFLHYFTNILSGLGIVLAAASTLILGVIIAYVLNIIMSFYEKKLLNRVPTKKCNGWKRVCSILMSICTIAIIVVLLVRLVVPELKNCIEVLFAGIPELFNQLRALAEEYPVVAGVLPEDFLSGGGQSFNMTEVMDKISTWATSGAAAEASSVVLKYVSGAISGILTFIMALIFALYILGGKETIKGQFHKLMDTYMKPTHKERFLYVLGTFNDSFHNFVVGQCMEAVIIGVLCIVGMLIFRFPYAVMIGALVGCTALIPIAGAYIGAVVGAIMILTVSPVKALLFIVFIVVLQQLEGQLIYPKVVGTSIGLPGIWVFATVVFGGALCGIQGILFGIPIVAGCYHLLRDDIRRRQLKK